MARPSEQSVLELTQTLKAFSAALSVDHPAWDLERHQRCAAALGRLEGIKKQIPVAVGGTGPVSWNDVPEERALQLSAELRALRAELLSLLEGDGPVEPEHHPMRYTYASTFDIYFLLLVGLIGAAVTLGLIVQYWPEATSGRPVDESKAPPGAPSAAAATSAAASASAVPPPAASLPQPSAVPSAVASSPPPPPSAEIAGKQGTAGLSGTGGDAGMASAPSASVSASASARALPKPAPSGSAAPASSVPVPKSSASPASPGEAQLGEAARQLNAAAQAPKDVSKGPIEEQDVLRMIILMGSLGGFLRLMSSMAKYVGNRALLRSWTSYYLLMPVVAASLAPIVYLLLRVGVLSSGSTATGASSTAHLNVFGLYGFAGLTGLFAEQAMGMLKDVFTRIFGGVEGKDPLQKGAGK